jgi:CDP-4-dehydro-6-deoxyglucose reductase
MKLINYEARPKLLDHVYEVKSYKLLTPHVVQIFLEPAAAPLLYEAGQYIKVVHPDKTTSPFSIANAPEVSSTLELHLLVLKKNGKAMEIFQQVKEKKPLILRGPFGAGTPHHLDAEKPLIFIARGTGFSPIKAVIEALSQKPTYPAIHFFWSAPGWRDLYLRDLIKDWVKTLRDFQFTAVLTREFLPHEPLEVVKYGSVPDLVLQAYPDLASHQVYVSGPETLVYEALEAFQQKGLSRENFYSDVFDYEP